MAEPRDDDAVSARVCRAVPRVADRDVDEPLVAAIVIALQRRYPDTNSDHIEASVVVELAARRTARIRRFLPLLVMRAVEERIRHDSLVVIAHEVDREGMHG
jgi:hypothetical protein